MLIREANVQRYKGTTHNRLETARVAIHICTLVAAASNARAHDVRLVNEDIPTASNNVMRTTETSATEAAAIRPVRLIFRPVLLRYLLALAIWRHISGKLRSEKIWKMANPGTATISRNPYSAICRYVVNWTK